MTNLSQNAKKLLEQVVLLRQFFFLLLIYVYFMFLKVKKHTFFNKFIYQKIR